MTSTQATEWLEKIQPEMKAYADKLIEADHPNASWEEKAIITMNVRNTFMNAARQGIADVKVILKLENDLPLWTYKMREKELAQKGLSGEKLNQKLYDEAFNVENLKLETTHKACFVAGTLVHTDKGLVPIEKLKVGDMVLSRHEDQPDGELAYKRVLNTFASKEKHNILRVAFDTLRDDIEPERLEKMKSGELSPIEKEYKGISQVFCTENHPFWTKEAGWVQAKDLPVYRRDKDEDRDYTLVCQDDKPAFGVSLLSYATPLYKTSVEGIAVQTCERSQRYGDVFAYVDFTQGEPKILKNLETWVPAEYDRFCDPDEPSIDLEVETSHPFSHNNTIDQVFFDWGPNIFGNNSEEKYYVDTVYNIEVEDYHTYFVGKDGIWVHNTDSCFTELVTVNPKVTVVRADTTRDEGICG